jgi:hypothetical protein
MYDNFSIFSDSQAVTANAASTKNILFMPFSGRGEPVKIAFKVTADFAALTSLTVAVQQTTAADTAFSSAETAASYVIPLAQLKVGKEHAIRFLPNISKPRVRLYYTVTGDTPTSGKVFAAVTEGEDFPYRDGLYFDGTNPSGSAATA